MKDETGFRLAGVFPAGFDWELVWPEWVSLFPGRWTFAGEGIRTLTWHDSFASTLYRDNKFVVEEGGVLSGFKRRGAFTPHFPGNWSAQVRPWLLLERYTQTLTWMEYRYLSESGEVTGRLRWTFGPLAGLEIFGQGRNLRRLTDLLELHLTEAGFREGPLEFFWGQTLFAAAPENRPVEPLFQDNASTWLKDLDRHFQGYLTTGDGECLRFFRSRLRSIRFLSPEIPPLLQKTGRLTRLQAALNWADGQIPLYREAAPVLAIIQRLLGTARDLVRQELADQLPADWTRLLAQLVLRNFADHQPLARDEDLRLLKQSVRKGLRRLAELVKDRLPPRSELDVLRSPVRKILHILVQNPALFNVRKQRGLMEALETFVDLTSGFHDFHRFQTQVLAAAKAASLEECQAVQELLLEMTGHWQSKWDRGRKSLAQAVQAILEAGRWLNKK